MAYKDDQVEDSDPTLALEVDSANLGMVDEIGAQKEGGARKGQNHSRFVGWNNLSPDKRIAQQEQNNTRAV